jgi:hypothetical protein
MTTYIDEKENILTGYCFLAALTEQQNDLYNHVFVPICKRALSIYSLKGGTHGKASDIKAIIFAEYGIDVPIVMIRRLIKSSLTSLSKRLRANHKIEIHENGDSFEINKYSFSDLELKYKKGQRNAQAIQTAFIEYLKSENIDEPNIPPFSDFLSSNKRHLAKFYRNNGSDLNEKVNQSFIHHVHFLELIETNNHELFSISQGLYIGSIVASYLEAGLDVEPKFESNEEYYLDTPVILRALDLQKEEETLPITELLDLIRTNGGKINVLSITVDEIHSVIENAIGSYNSTTPTTTINEACVRLGKNKSWLIGYNAKLPEHIDKVLKAKIIPVTNSFREKHAKSADVKALQNTRQKKGNALHDVLAYLYVRDVRGGIVQSLQKARVWFITSNSHLLSFNRENNPNKGISEIILTDALTSLLWLKDPSKLFDKVKTIGLAELMANTLSEEIATNELINEFANNIASVVDVNGEDYRILLESVAHESARMIDNFNETIHRDRDEGKVEVFKMIERERSRKVRQQRTVKTAQQSEKETSEKNKELIEKLNIIQKELELARNNSANTTTQIEELSQKLDVQHAEISNMKIALRTHQKRIIFGLICLLFSLLTLIFKEYVHTWVRLLGYVSNTGWIWGLCSFIINFYKLSKGK